MRCLSPVSAATAEPPTEREGVGFQLANATRSSESEMSLAVHSRTSPGSTHSGLVSADGAGQLLEDGQGHLFALQDAADEAVRP